MELFFHCVELSFQHLQAPDEFWHAPLRHQDPAFLQVIDGGEPRYDRTGLDRFNHAAPGSYGSVIAYRQVALDASGCTDLNPIL
jgi:hypothetical protein